MELVASSLWLAQLTSLVLRDPKLRSKTTLLAVFFGLCATQAEAHAFKSGADFYAQFQEGVSVILAYPQTLLPLLALGVLLSLWQPEGLLRVWPMFLAGLVIGFFAGPLVGTWIVSTTLAVGIATAILAAILERHSDIETKSLGFGLGFLTMASSLEGHAFFELPFFIYFGIFLAANMVVAVAAGLTRYALERWKQNWMRIVWRVVASWIAAISLLLIAFAIRQATGG